MKTYARWRDNTPSDFQFAVKLPRSITHELKLQNVHEPLTDFLSQTGGLAEKRGPILVQLPPSLAFDLALITAFLDTVRSVYDGALVCEPRHATWFTRDVDALLTRYRVSRVAADPPPVPGADMPSGWPELVYFRLHGSPRMYWSRYDERYLATLAATLQNLPLTTTVWCIFDNTATGSAVENAWELRSLIPDP